MLERGAGRGFCAAQPRLFLREQRREAAASCQQQQGASHARPVPFTDPAAHAWDLHERLGGDYKRHNGEIDAHFPLTLTRSVAPTCPSPLCQCPGLSVLSAAHTWGGSWMSPCGAGLLDGPVPFGVAVSYTVCPSISLSHQNPQTENQASGPAWFVLQTSCH